MKILYLLFSIFFLVLQSSPGFTQRITNSQACNRAEGFCSRSCPSSFSVIGSCGFSLICLPRVSDGSKECQCRIAENLADDTLLLKSMDAFHLSCKVSRKLKKIHKGALVSPPYSLFFSL
ncbi:lingual antimicrobial peptide-like [Malaclemys terrapin pileata]|uniref:lingual antimicrobial peptide-like n=1 Tax=Malaclemys terrapin pileata TaxID=2991368 RepID=UPI0023A7E93D|nr:lingual antimicrobial peptide-like [Malaclemys terrapin pileata]